MRSETSQLLAKSARYGRPPLTLVQHLRDTEEAAYAVFRLDRRWGHAFCRFFGLSEVGVGRFLLNLRVAALFHDLGKANDEFQRAITGGRYTQSLRHEHISALILQLAPVRDWIEKNPELDFDIIVAAVLSHHLKAADDGPFTWGQSRGAPAVQLRLDDEQVASTLARVSEVAGIPELEIHWETAWRDRSPWSEALVSGRHRATRLRRSLRSEADVGKTERRQLLLAVKAGLIVADSLASGLVREGHPITDWIDDVAHADPVSGEQLERDVIQPRLRQLERQRGAPVILQAFQTMVESRGRRVLLLAACGAGKTLAAWRWAGAQLSEVAAGRVIFLYPTRGTATEGFRDYVGWAPEADAALVHGTSRYELDAMAENPPESAAGKTFSDEAAARLFALGLWSKRYFSATVDQFLAFMEHRYESLCLLPALADSVVIFDEIHSYDESLFRNLVAFLRNFDVPALCMTATLPSSRQRELLESGLAIFPSAEDRASLEDLEQRERSPRYTIVRCSDRERNTALVADAVARGERVLWVVNVVARCQALAQQLETALGREVLCYHSRFRLRDRQTAHQCTVAAFQQAGRAALAVTTQVCEMSLDLDADVLITELAPTSSLVQRFGRSNRHGARGPNFRARIVVTPVPSPAPYQPEDLQQAERFLSAVAGSDVSQRQLADALLEHSRDEPSLDASARFLEGGYYATPGSLRDESNHLASCVLDTDLPDLQATLGARRPIDGFLLSAPRRFLLPAEASPDWLPRYLGVVPGERYDTRLGFQEVGR